MHITHWTVLKLSSVSDPIAVAILSSRLPSRIPVRRTDRSMRKSFYSASSLARVGFRRFCPLARRPTEGPPRSQKAQKYRPIWSRQRTRRGFDRRKLALPDNPKDEGVRSCPLHRFNAFLFKGRASRHSAHGARYDVELP